MTWVVVTKADSRARAMADRHYTRQHPGHSQWTRPGYSAVLIASAPLGQALFVWWRPKWEHGTPGTDRKDHLRCLECTHFRREGSPAQEAEREVLPKASTLILEAVEMLTHPDVRAELHIDTAGEIRDGLITGVGTTATASRRSKHAEPGRCFQMAGWQRMEKCTRRASVWWQFQWTDPGPRPGEARGLRFDDGQGRLF